MRIIDKNSKPVVGAKLIEGFAKDYFLGDNVRETEYRKLSVKEKKHLITEMVLTEYAGLMQDMTNKALAIFGRDVTQDGKSIRQARMTEIGTVLNESHYGDVTKLKAYNAIDHIIRYSKEVNSAAPHPTPEQQAYLDAIIVCETGIGYLKSHTAQFQAAIQKELPLIQEGHALDRAVVAYLFYSVMYNIFNTANLIFGISFVADFDYTKKPPIANNIRFEFDGKEHVEDLAFIENFNNFASTGQLKEFLNKIDHTAPNMDKQAYLNNINNPNHSAAIVKESCIPSFRDYLDRATSNMLSENVGDVAMAFMTSNKVLDLVFLPIYFIRYMIYLAKYIVVSYKNVSASIQRSLDILKKQNLTSDEYQAYKHTMEKESMEDERGSDRAYATLDSHVKEDKALVATASSNSPTSNSLML